MPRVASATRHEVKRLERARVTVVPQNPAHACVSDIAREYWPYQGGWHGVDSTP
jgi:hypothetical protein